MNCLDGSWVLNDTGCHIWVKAKTKDGYGKLRFNGKTMRAHRLSFQFNNPNVDIEGCVIMHTCDTPACINPAHLERGSQLDNVVDMIRKGRQAVLRGDLSPHMKVPKIVRDEIRSLYAFGSYS